MNYANFAVNANGATPSTVTGTAPQQQVNLVAGANVQHTITGTVTPTVAAGGLVVFKAGTAGIKITMNATLGFVTIYQLTLNCTPNDITVGQTAVVGSATTCFTSMIILGTRKALIGYHSA